MFKQFPVTANTIPLSYSYSLHLFNILIPDILADHSLTTCHARAPHRFVLNFTQNVFSLTKADGGIISDNKKTLN